MKLTKLPAILISLLLLGFANLSSASTVTINYSFSFGPGLESGSGSFTGTPNASGIINFGDLSSFSLTDPLAGPGGTSATLATLNSFGSFNTATNIWSPNAADWDGVTLDAWFTWNSFANSLNLQDMPYGSDIAPGTNTFIAGGVNQLSPLQAVPEPPELAIMGIGLIGLAGLAALRRRTRDLSRRIV